MILPPDFPPILYKYRLWSNEFHKNALVHRQLYLADPNSFNDPFDCRIFPNYTILTTNETKLIQYVDGLMRNGNHPPGWTHSQVKGQVQMKLSNLDQFHRDAEQIELNGYKRHLGVLSLSKRWNSNLMWSHYSDNHKGYCIGLNHEKLVDSKLFGSGGPIIYDAFPDLEPMPIEDTKEMLERSFIQTHHKSSEWEYEQEFRLTKLEHPGILQRLVTLPEGIIKEVIIGLDMPKAHAAEVEAISKSINIDLFKMVKKQFSFELDRIQVS